MARLRALARDPVPGGAVGVALAARARDWPAEPWDLDAWPDYPPAERGAWLAEAPTTWIPRVEAAPPTAPEDVPPQAARPTAHEDVLPEPPVWAPPTGLLEHALASLRARVPAPLRGGRWDPGRRGAHFVAALGLLAALAAVGFALHGRARPVAAPAPPQPAAAAADDPLAAGPSLQLDVEGRVRRPGLVSVPSGARVAQALTAAGGVLPGTDTRTLDLAQKVTDGQQLMVGGSPPVAAASSSTGAATMAATVDLNTATADQLDALPHVGPATAQKIITWRTEHGPFTAVSQLQQVSGIGPSTYQDIAPLVTV